MSMYADYCKEREGYDVYETDEGFLSYSIRGEEVYIIDLFVKPEARKSGHAAKMADYICAKAHAVGVKFVTGSVDPRASSATEGMKVLLAYGMRVHSIEGPLIYFIKEIV